MYNSTTCCSTSHSVLRCQTDCCSVSTNRCALPAAEARKRDIPIVQLNPGGTLNHKYAGETAVRGSGLPYSVLRSTGTYWPCRAHSLTLGHFILNTLSLSSFGGRLGHSQFVACFEQFAEQLCMHVCCLQPLKVTSGCACQQTTAGDTALGVSSVPHVCACLRYSSSLSL